MGPARRAGRLGTVLSFMGGAGVVLTQALIVFRVPADAGRGIVEAAASVLVPLAWITALAFTVTAAASAIYLWWGDDRADAMAYTGLFAGLLILRYRVELATREWTRRRLRPEVRATAL